MLLRSVAVAVPNSGYRSAGEGTLSLDKGWINVTHDFVKTTLWLSLQIGNSGVRNSVS